MIPTQPEQLIVRFLSNEASSEEQIKLFDWINENSNNQILFNQYCEIWSNSYKSPLKIDTNAALDALNKRLEFSKKELAPKRHQTAIAWWKLAAAFLVLLVAGASLHVNSSKETPILPVAWQERTNPPGQKSTIHLSDGTVIKLNSKSQLRFPENFAEAKREVYLEGEAFFEVAKDASRPFLIHSGKVATEVLGTSFNIRTNGTSTEVSVATGKVKVTMDSAQEILLPNQKVTFWPEENKWERKETLLINELAWKNNTILLTNTTLEDAARILENWYGVTIEFENESIKQCRITGTYENESLKNILEAIKFSSTVDFKLSKKEVLFIGKGCL
jgi:transmembrane sensor